MAPTPWTETSAGDFVQPLDAGRRFGELRPGFWCWLEFAYWFGFGHDLFLRTILRFCAGVTRRMSSLARQFVCFMRQISRQEPREEREEPAHWGKCRYPPNTASVDAFVIAVCAATHISRRRSPSHRRTADVVRCAPMRRQPPRAPNQSLGEGMS